MRADAKTPRLTPRAAVLLDSLILVHHNTQPASTDRCFLAYAATPFDSRQILVQGQRFAIRHS